ncbi:MAG TPA: hypothetical protein VM238_00765, partial [Phycisphaerae bacterium]|nr:hypothetical protein [Phycisphaerae bacterium]
ELLAGRIGETNSQYERGMGKPKDFHFLSDKSRRILSGMGVEVDVIDPGGKTSQAPSPTTQPPAGAEAGPAIGERRLINGVMGEWDGKGWKAVK